jgi:NAD+ kinase
MKKLHFVSDKTFKANTYKKNVLKKYKNYSPYNADVIVVIGGDGFMLQTLKKFQKYKKPFYGINRGSFGFLMNKFKKNNLQNILKSKVVTISPLQMYAITKNNIKKNVIAINEISLLRQSKQTASLQIVNKKKVIIKKLVCDGILVSTPAGSTAYNSSVNGPILSLNSRKIVVTPISPFRPRKLKYKILPTSSIIKIINLNIKKRPISVVADNVEVRNIKSVKITINKNIKFKLLYDRNSSLEKKISVEKFRNKVSSWN